MPLSLSLALCLTFIDLKKAFDSVETETVVEALDNQGVPTPYIKIFQRDASIGMGRHAYLGRELNMMNDLTSELGRRKRAAWGAFKSIDDVVKRIKNTRLRAHLFNITVLPALTYTSETWRLCRQKENAVNVIERAVERVMLGVSRFTHVRERSKIKGDAAYAKGSKINLVGHVMCFNDNRWTVAVSDWIPRDIKRTAGGPPTQWSDFFTMSCKENYDALRVPRERRNHWATLVRDRDQWKNYWLPLDQFEDQRESSPRHLSPRDRNKWRPRTTRTNCLLRYSPPSNTHLHVQVLSASEFKSTSSNKCRNATAREYDASSAYFKKQLHRLCSAAALTAQEFNVDPKQPKLDNLDDDEIEALRLEISTTRSSLLKTYTRITKLHDEWIVIQQSDPHKLKVFDEYVSKYGDYRTSITEAVNQLEEMDVLLNTMDEEFTRRNLSIPSDSFNTSPEEEHDHTWLNRTEAATTTMRTTSRDKSIGSQVPATNSSLLNFVDASILSKLELPTFDGNLLDYPEFASRFATLVGNKTQLDDTTKLSLLKSCLRGRALQSIQG
ncbi:hypothetical protein RB195_022866 [Necator americanus]|uniref:Reverse transcriptase domain-containing protein n=1 Tax=Necator americanus TaxID=51031 RepID=A0ABR1EGX0_NECAM